MKTSHIHVVPYRSYCADDFQRLAALYHTWLNSFILTIEHVGSPSVLGLAVKPIIDIDLLIERPNYPVVKSRLEVMEIDIHTLKSHPSFLSESGLRLKAN